MVESIVSTKQKLDDGEQASVAKSVDAANLKFASPWLAGSNPAARTNQQTRGSAMIDRTYLFRSAGYALLGAKWQRPLSRALGPYHPDGARQAIDDAAVRKWAAGSRRVPDWVWGALHQMLGAAPAAIRADANEAFELSGRRADSCQRLADEVRGLSEARDPPHDAPAETGDENDQY